MKMYFTISMIILMAVPTWAAKVNQPKCDDIVQINDQFTPQYIALVDGYSKAGKKQGEEIDVAGIVTQSAQVKKNCQSQKTKPMASVRKDVSKSVAASSTPSKINPVKASCEEFIALGEQYQPVAAFWVAGHDKSGKAVKDGEIDTEFIARPILTLVQDCKENPKSSFYARAKTWLAKRL
jgi:hypothetical protein